MTKKLLNQLLKSTLENCFDLYNAFIGCKMDEESFDNIYMELDETIDLALSIKYLLVNFDELGKDETND